MSKSKKRRNKKLVKSIQRAEDSLAIVYGQKQFEPTGGFSVSKLFKK